jgi:hypothetical protein
VTIDIGDPAFHVLVFAPLSRADYSNSSLARTWAAASHLGINEPTPGSDRPVELPEKWPQDDVWFRIVAGKADVDGRDAAIAFTAHDVAAVMVRLRPSVGSVNNGNVFGDLSRAWRDATGGQPPTETVFGAAHVFTGVTDQPPHTLATTAADAAHKVLSDEADTGLELSCVVEPGIALWSLEVPWGRSVVLLAGRHGASLVGEWCWLTASNDNVGRLVRYFMHASKLRFEIALFQDRSAELREREKKLDAGLTELFALHERFEESGAGANELIDAQSSLGRAQGDATGLLISITYLRDLRQTVAIAAQNLKAHEPAILDAELSTTSPFVRELALAEWFDHQVGHEIAYLESCRERAREAQALTDLRLQQLAAAQARKANWLMVLQTSILGALLGTFSVASALHTFSAPMSVRAPLIALVGLMLLALPPLAVRWPNRYAWPELATVAVVGAAAGVAVAVSLKASLLIVIASAVLGAAVLGAAANLVNGRRPSH